MDPLRIALDHTLAHRLEALALLQREERLQQIVKLVGPDVLPDAQRLVLFVAEILKEGYLAQSAYDERDAHCSPERQALLLRIILTLHRRGLELIEAGIPLARLRSLPLVGQVMRAKSTHGNSDLDGLVRLERSVREQLDALWPTST